MTKMFFKIRDPHPWFPKTKIIDGLPSWYRACLVWQLYGFECRHLSKIENRRHKPRNGQHTLAHQKNIQKNYLFFTQPEGFPSLRTTRSIPYTALQSINLFSFSLSFKAILDFLDLDPRSLFNLDPEHCKHIQINKLSNLLLQLSVRCDNGQKSILYNNMDYVLYEALYIINNFLFAKLVCITF
jgi:hypothetical protein